MSRQITRRESKRKITHDADNSRPSKIARASTSSGVATIAEEPVRHPSHSQAIPGTVLVLGNGDMGQLGLGPDVQEKRRPALLKFSSEGDSEPLQMVQVCAGGIHSVAVSSTGVVCTWGCNDEGALGRDTSEEDSESTPGPVQGLIDLRLKVIQVSAGDSHTAALTDMGRVFLWGSFRNSSGVFGLTSNASEAIQRTPVEAMAGHVMVKIASGTDHLVALSQEGALFTMGCGEQGQLGRVPHHQADRGGRRGLSLLLQPAACRVRGGVTFSDVWAGSASTVAITSEGQLYACGLNNYGQLGIPGADEGDFTFRFMLERVQLPGYVGRVKMFALGQHHSLLLNTDGRVFAIGRIDYGRLGVGAKEDLSNEAAKLEWTKVVGELATKEVAYVACGTAVSFAIEKDSGRLWAWGMASNLQLGTGSEDEDIYLPQPMQGNQLAEKHGVLVSAGGQHTLMLVTQNSQNGMDT